MNWISEYLLPSEKLRGTVFCIILAIEDSKSLSCAFSASVGKEMYTWKSHYMSIINLMKDKWLKKILKQFEYWGFQVNFLIKGSITGYTNLILD